MEGQVEIHAGLAETESAALRLAGDESLNLGMYGNRQQGGLGT